MTSTQEKQIRFLEKLEPFETLGNIRDINLHCYTCKEDLMCHAADTAKRFIRTHENHKTWVEAGKNYNPLTKY